MYAVLGSPLDSALPNNTEHHIDMYVGGGGRSDLSKLRILLPGATTKLPHIIISEFTFLVKVVVQFTSSDYRLTVVIKSI